MRTRENTPDHTRSHNITSDYTRTHKITPNHTRSHENTCDARSQQITWEHTRSHKNTCVLKRYAVCFWKRLSDIWIRLFRFIHLDLFTLSCNGTKSEVKCEVFGFLPLVGYLSFILAANFLRTCFWKGLSDGWTWSCSLCKMNEKCQINLIITF